MSKRTVGTAAVAALAVAASVAAQGNPRGSASATVGGKSVTVEYGRPALKGRDLDALLKQLPADRIWRAGENQVTTLTAAGDLLVGGRQVAAGKYSLYVHAAEGGGWSLVLNRDPGVPLGKIWSGAPENMKNEPWPHYTDYSQTIAASEVVRVPMKKAPGGPPADLFSISFKPSGQGQELTLAWGAQAWSVELQPAK